jgi:hypothetical protein
LAAEKCLQRLWDKTFVDNAISLLDRFDQLFLLRSEDVGHFENLVVMNAQMIAKVAALHVTVTLSSTHAKSCEEWTLHLCFNA